MSKTIHRPETKVLVDLIKEIREDAGLTQVQLSEKLGRAQSFISDVERGHRRLDLVQLLDLCRAVDISLSGFVRRFERKVD